jgi:hypothetical protein
MARKFEVKVKIKEHKDAKDLAKDARKMTKDGGRINDPCRVVPT